MKAIISARLADWHICFKGRKGVWACGKTPDEAIREFKRTAASHDLPTDFECEYADDARTQEILAGTRKFPDAEEVRDVQEIHLMVGWAMRGRAWQRS